MLTTSVVEFQPQSWANVKSCLESAEAVDIYGVDEGRALVIIESSDEKGVEYVCAQLQEACSDIISISHHSFYFEEDASNLPPASELFRKKI
ncbi:MAG: chaperone NapD [Deferribacteraceae bacterium]|nr:chaperone NapD [Deferribacteraceae bacterium]